jgi:hypothetical protein
MCCRIQAVAAEQKMTKQQINQEIQDAVQKVFDRVGAPLIENVHFVAGVLVGVMAEREAKLRDEIDELKALIMQLRKTVAN